MKNTICEKLMWSAMTPAIFKYIAAQLQKYGYIQGEEEIA